MIGISFLLFVEDETGRVSAPAAVTTAGPVAGDALRVAVSVPATSVRSRSRRSGACTFQISARNFGPRNKVHSRQKKAATVRGKNAGSLNVALVKKQQNAKPSP